MQARAAALAEEDYSDDPDPYDDPEVEKAAVEDVRACIRFIEEQTGEKYDFVNDDRENRRYVTELLTWEKIQP